MRIKQWVRGLWFDWTHRHVDRDVCCCGSSMSEHGWWDNHSPVEAYSYYRDLYVRGK